MTRVIAPDGQTVDFPDPWPTVWHWLATVAVMLGISAAGGLLAGWTSVQLSPTTHSDAASAARDLAARGQIAADCTTSTCLIAIPRTNP